MQKRSLTLLVGAVVLLAGTALLVPDLLSEHDTPIGRWQAKDEVEVPAEPAVPVNAGEEGSGGLERSAVELASPPPGADDRIEVVLRGRVIDKFQAPIAQATVWLEHGRGGVRGGPNERNRRVPDPVRTDAEGRFAFQGETFRQLRVTLQIAHDNFAVGRFDKDVGRVAKEVDLGDLVLAAGGELRGRVTDLEGNGVPAAQLRLQPENENTLRLLRDRERLLPPFVADQNGYFRRPHLAAGDWSLVATAKMHTEGRSPAFVVEEEQAVDIDDIRLGPGFELSGTVRSVRGEPIAKANVVLQGETRRDGRGGPNAGAGREHRATTDEQGRFFVEHLPGVSLRLLADAAGHLNTRLEGIDPTVGQALDVTMLDGLRIEGRVRDADGDAVTLFAFRAVRLRGLAAPGQANPDVGDLLGRSRGSAEQQLSEAAVREVRAQIEGLRAEMAAPASPRGRGPGGPGGQDGARAERGGNAPRRQGELDRPEQHAGGTFVATGLQEGLYEVHVQSPDHARYRSAEIELRSGASPPRLEVVLDAGVFVAGVVVDSDGVPVPRANVELREPPAPRTTESTIYFVGGMREAMRSAGAQAALEATTDAQGAFLIKHVPRGTWRLHADARGYANATTEPFELTADHSGFELQLGKLGSIAGTVSDLRPEEIAQARVGAVPLGNANGGLGTMFIRGRTGVGGGGGPFQNVSVAADGSYKIEELAAGEYVVRAWIGSPQDLMRELAPRFGDGTLRSDAVVEAGKTTKLDLVVTRPLIGTVEGTVLNNGNPAAGWSVDLVQQEDNTGGNTGRRIRWGGFGSHRSTVATSGRFTIAKVPAGNYTLRVQGPRGRDVMYEEPVQVLPASTLDRLISVLTHSLQGTVTRDDGGKPADLNGVVLLMPGLTTMPEDIGPLRASSASSRLNDGAFRFESVKPGPYLAVLVVPGRERTSAPVTVHGDQSITIAAGKATSKPGGAGGSTSPANGQPR